jgi:hypothetical protein
VCVPIFSPIGPSVWPPIADNTTQDRTEAILEKYNILEPVSVGGWTKIRLRRITRSTTCICLRIRTYIDLLCDMRAAPAPHPHFALGAVAAPCSIPVRRPECELRARRPHNLCPLPQCVFVPIWVQSVQPVGRQCGMCGAARTFTRASMRTRDRRPP